MRRRRSRLEFAERYRCHRRGSIQAVARHGSREQRHRRHRRDAEQDGSEKASPITDRRRAADPPSHSSTPVRDERQIFLLRGSWRRS